MYRIKHSCECVIVIYIHKFNSGKKREIKLFLNTYLNSYLISSSLSLVNEWLYWNPNNTRTKSALTFLIYSLSFAKPGLAKKVKI